MATAEIPTRGMMVRVRSRRHVVEEVTPPMRGHPLERHLVVLSCVDDDNAGERAEVIWENEPDARILSARESAALEVDALDPPERFAAWYYALRWNSLSVAETKRVQAPFRAGISVESYQFLPLHRALEQPRVRLFIADDVGLGKTIEAALIVREMILRQRVRRVVVAAPPSVLTQWRDELDTRFGLTFVVVDRAYFRARRRERGWNYNPWRTHSRFIISHALLRDPHYTTALRDLLRAEPTGSMLVLDEAHHAAPASGARTAVDSAFTRVVRELAPLFEHRVFLSATPHNGHSASFSALMEILDPSRFVRGIKVTAPQRKQVMVRRLKRELRAVGVEFAERSVVRIALEGLAADDPDLVLLQHLDAYCVLREAAAAAASPEEQQNNFLSLNVLRKRLLSSVSAFANTLRAHREGLVTRRNKRRDRVVVQPELLEAPGPDDERASDAPEELEAEAREVEAEVAAGAVPLAATPGAAAALEALIALADTHARRPDARIRALIAWMRDNLFEGTPPAWGSRRLLIFTEYVDTQRYIVDKLREAFGALGKFNQRVDTLDGRPDGEGARDEIKRRFNTPPEAAPLRVLVCTDAAREGINLQAHCADLFHFDLPWNPSRIEQRNGRIDRKGQPAAVVRCHYFVHTQRPEDMVLDALVQKTETIRKELGTLGEVILEGTEAILKRGVSRREAEAQALKLQQLPLPGVVTVGIDAADAENEPEEGPEVVIDAAPSAERSRDEVDDAPPTQAQLQEAKAYNDVLQQEAEAAMEFSPERFRRVLDVALGLLGAPPLAPDLKTPGLWHLPPLDGSPATHPAHATATLPRVDASWAETLDGLRIPFGQEPGHDPERHRPDDRWGWRRRSRLRPLRFRASATADADTVHLHLEHRVVQRLLGQLSAQGFIQGGLSRATAFVTGDGADRVILLGRLCLFGPGGVRLHDEILWRAAAWPGAAAERTRPLQPFALRSTEEVAVAKDFQVALTATDAPPLSDFLRRRLLQSVATDVAELTPSLQRTVTTQSEAVRTRLARIAERQAQSLDQQLQRQQVQLTRRLSQSSQLSLAQQKGFDEADRAAWKATLRAWERRLTDLDRERTSAPTAVRNAYAVQHTHFELVGVVYLVRGT